MVLLIIEDDLAFARIMVEFAREKKFKAVVARTAAQGMALALMVKPSAITLDLRLPDQDGWVVIDWLKHHPQMRHIPVHIISVDEERERSLRLGAVSYLQKPVTREALDHALSDTMAFLNRPVKSLLVIEDDDDGRGAVVDLIADEDVKVTAVGTGQAALAELEKQPFDCIVMDLGLPDMKGAALLKEIHQRLRDKAPPVIVYTGQELSREEETELRMNAESIIVKSVRSPERLLDETSLFLHRVQSKLPDSKRKLIEQGQRADPILVGRKVLVVDDDVRNIFAITSALESYQMSVLYAESGKAALDTLKATPDVDIVLMDVMMPEMDGFQTIREIRKQDRFKKMPIISVTAKAMKGDREKCLEAGASDYIAKPVDMDKLRSLLRVWLYR
jgi:CheY-like chemotaxis protein